MESQGAIFNGSIATLQRIDTILKKLHESFTMTQVFWVKQNLSCLYKEVYPFLNQDERLKGKELWDIIDKGVKINPSGTTCDCRLSWSSFNDFDFWLRDQLNNHGLLMAKGEDPAFALE